MPVAKLRLGAGARVSCAATSTTRPATGDGPADGLDGARVAAGVREGGGEAGAVGVGAWAAVATGGGAGEFGITDGGAVVLHPTRHPRDIVARVTESRIFIGVVVTDGGATM